MNSQLTTEEIFQLLSNRFYRSLSSGERGNAARPYSISDYNAVLSILSDFVESFSNGGLQIKAVE